MSESKSGIVYVVDDDEAVRDAISLLLDSVDMAFMTFASADDFLQQLNPEDHGALVLDIRMPGTSGLELQQHLAQLNISIPIIFITGHGDIPMAVEAMRRGAVDFIRKPFRDQELLDRISEALRLDQAQQSAVADLAQIRARVESLTPRETEVFDRVCAGQANKVMAIEMNISERTVEIHRGQVMQKMGVRSLAELVRMKLSLERSASD